MSKNIRDRVHLDDWDRAIWFADEDFNTVEWYGELVQRTLDYGSVGPLVVQYVLYIAYDEMAAGDRWISVHSTEELAKEQMYAVFEELFAHQIDDEGGE